MHLFRQGAFSRLFAGTALNAIGTWATLIALWGYATVHFHQGATGLTVIGLCWGLPMAVLSPIAGIPLDRLGPKRVLLTSNLLGAAASVGLALAGTFDVLVAVAACAGTVESFGRPAAMALPARIVAPADLLGANALIGAAEQSSMIFGPVVGAAVITAAGIQGAFLVDAATFLVGAAAVASLRTAPPPLTEDRPSSLRALVRDLAEGIAVARRSVTIRRALVLAIVSYLSWGAFFVLEPLYVRTVVHRSPAVLGLLQTAFGIGLVGISLLVPRLGDRVVSVRALAATVIAAGVAAGTYVGTRHLVVAFIGVWAWGAIMGLFLSPLQTLLQRAAPSEAEGRILALSSTANGIGNTATIPVAGLLVTAIGVQLTGIAVGAALVIAGAVALAVATRRPSHSPPPSLGPLELEAGPAPVLAGPGLGPVGAAGQVATSSASADGELG